ncbi:MAG: transposase [Candidatus Sumerlaeota bacterium]|nr:transposase [Candidatus Sumerlaeota bacterium]
MRFLRLREPNDPDLWRLSKVVPDDWIDEQWPQHGARKQGRWKEWRSSQLARAHLLALIKALGSFNRVCAELRHNGEFRRFCRVPPRRGAPRPGTLTKFRQRLGVEGWRAVHGMLVRSVAALAAPCAAGLALVDSTDLPAAVRRTWEKGGRRRERGGWATWAPGAADARRRAGSPTTSWASRSTRSAASSAGRGDGA